jgi:beta-lactamase regulating signal transducer with metallopeptidase domain/predicted  nucleic acid-binding Zn-ribbon protein
MNVLAPAFVSALGWALVHFLWQGLAVGMVTAVALMLLSNARPQARYAIACLALTLCVALPFVSVIHNLHADTSIAAASTPASVAVTQVAPSLNIASLASWQTPLQTRLPWIVATWSLGAGLLTLRMAMGLAWVDRIKRMHASADPQWQPRLDRLVTLFGLRSAVSLRVVAELDSPVAAGWWRPMVLVPAALLARMAPELLEALLAHELAHIKRHDYLINLIQRLIEALLFYHPAVWWLSKQIRIERERIADDMAACAIGEPRRVALALQQLDLLLATRDQLANPQLTPAANGGNLMSRIDHLIRPDQRALSWKIALPIVGLSVMCLTVLAQSDAPATRGRAAAASVTIYDTEVTGSTRKAPYALVREGHESMTVSGTTRDIREAEKAKRSLQGDFLWFRRGGKAYVIQDAAILAKATRAWQPAEALNERMEALSGKMEIHSEAMEGLSEKMQTLSNRNEPVSDEMEKLGTKMKALSQQQEAIGEKLELLSEQMDSADDDDDDDEREVLDRKMDALHARMEPLNQQMQKLSAMIDEQAQQMDAEHLPLEDLSRQMEEASNPMEALGKQMEALGKQQEKLSLEADRVIRMLIDAAFESGKAVPTSTFN